MGLVKTRRLAAMHPPSPRLRRTGKQQRAKAGMTPPVPNSRQPKWMSGPSTLMKMAMAKGEYRVAMESATDPESFDFNRGEYLLCRKRYEEALADAQTKSKPYGII